MPPPFTEAQLAMIEEEWEMAISIGESRPDKKQCRNLAVRFLGLGWPWVPAQEIGKYYAGKAARREGRPRARAKTPEQLALLEQAFDEDPYPPAGTVILLTYQTRLQPKQVKAWFGQKRTKLSQTDPYFGQQAPCELPPTEIVTAARRMWREYAHNPYRYAKDLWLGRVDHVTGRYVGCGVDGDAKAEATVDRVWAQQSAALGWSVVR